MMSVWQKRSAKAEVSQRKPADFTKNQFFPPKQDHLVLLQLLWLLHPSGWAEQEKEVFLTAARHHLVISDAMKEV